MTKEEEEIELVKYNDFALELKKTFRFMSNLTENYSLVNQLDD